MNEHTVQPADTLAADAPTHELKSMRSDWWCFLLLGILLVVGGTAAIIFPFLSSVGFTMLLGAVLFVSGAATVLSAFWTGRWSGFLLHLLIGILYAVIGLAIIDQPLEATVGLTLFVATFAIVAGACRVVAALSVRFPQWGWALLNGAVTLLFGVLVYRLFPEDPAGVLWIIGFLIGLEILLNGWTWIMLALELRSLPATEASSAAP